MTLLNKTHAQPKQKAKQPQNLTANQSLMLCIVRKYKKIDEKKLFKEFLEYKSYKDTQQAKKGFKTTLNLLLNKFLLDEENEVISLMEEEQK